MAVTLYDLAGDDPAIMFSPFAWRIRMALLHKGLDFEVVPWRFSARDAIAPSGHTAIPVIHDGDTWVGDSWEIVRYLDQLYPERPMLMAGAAGEAHARLSLAICGSNVFPAAIPVAIFQAYQILDDASKPYFRESREAMFGKTLEDLHAEEDAGRAGLAAGLKPFEEVLKHCTYVGGDAPSYADYALFGILKWADIVSTYEPLDADSAVGAWFARLSDLYDGYAGKVPTVRSRA